jgi:hypothetical protein
MGNRDLYSNVIFFRPKIEKNTIIICLFHVQAQVTGLSRA